MKVLVNESAKLYLAQVLNGRKEENVKGIYFDEKWVVFKGNPIEFYEFENEDQALFKLMDVLK